MALQVKYIRGLFHDLSPLECYLSGRIPEAKTSNNSSVPSRTVLIIIPFEVQEVGKTRKEVDREVESLQRKLFEACMTEIAGYS